MTDTNSQSSAVKSFALNTFSVLSALAVIPASMWLGYNLGKNTLESENRQLSTTIAILTESKGAIDLINSLQNLRTAHEGLFEFEKFASQISALEKHNGELENVVAQTQSEVTSLQATLEKQSLEFEKVNEILKRKYTLSEEFILSEERSKTFFDGEVTVGLVNNYGSFAEVSIRDRINNLRVGEAHHFTVNLFSCKVTFLGTLPEEQKGQFNIICDQ